MLQVENSLQSYACCTDIEDTFTEGKDVEVSTFPFTIHDSNGDSFDFIARLNNNEQYTSSPIEPKLFFIALETKGDIQRNFIYAPCKWKEWEGVFLKIAEHVQLFRGTAKRLLPSLDLDLENSELVNIALVQDVPNSPRVLFADFYDPVLEEFQEMFSGEYKDALDHYKNVYDPIFYRKANFRKIKSLIKTGENPVEIEVAIQGIKKLSLKQTVKLLSLISPDSFRAFTSICSLIVTKYLRGVEEFSFQDFYRIVCVIGDHMEPNLDSFLVESYCARRNGDIKPSELVKLCRANKSFLGDIYELVDDYSMSFYDFCDLLDIEKINWGICETILEHSWYDFSAEERLFIYNHENYTSYTPLSKIEEKAASIRKKNAPHTSSLSEIKEKLGVSSDSNHIFSSPVSGGEERLLVG